MSRFLMVNCRKGCEDENMEEKIKAIDNYLSPDNIESRPLIVRKHGETYVAVFNPSSTISFDGPNLCLGHMFEEKNDWHCIGATPPDGCYAMVRVGDQCVELITDVTASRTIWYVKTEKFFAASSSMRALICLLGDFEPNKEAFAWMLSSGTLGPGYAWDRRISMLPARSSLVFDANTWDSKVNTQPVDYIPLDKSRQKFKEETLSQFKKNFSSLDARKSRICVPLSGGYDSRAILMLLNDRECVQAVTWGEKTSLLDSESDAAVASKVADALGVPHDFFPLDIPTGSLNRIIDRFLAIGEGRVDHISGYLDGFHIWKELHGRGYEAILRGDLFFMSSVNSPPVPFDARQHGSIGLVRLCDYQNLPSSEDLGFPVQSLPKELLPKADETLDTYRDRLYHAFRMPITLSALNELKASYVEVINPFVSSRYFDLVRTQPDSIRKNKSILCDIVEGDGPDIPIASHTSVQKGEDFLSRTDLKEIIISELHSDLCRELMIGPVMNIAEEGVSMMGVSREAIKSGEETVSVLRRLRKVLGRFRRKLSGPKPWGKPVMDKRVFALRVFLIVRTCRMLYKDALLFQENDDQSGTKGF